MAASESTALQINYKLADGTLVNVYAKDGAHLEALLTNVSDLTTLISATAAALGANTTPAANVAYAKQALGGTEISDTKVCKHGNMSLRTGTNARGPWKGWMCAAPKGAADKCETIWVR